LYNLLHLEVEGDEERNTIAQTDQLNKKILSLKLKSFHTKNKDGVQGTKQKRRRTDDGASADGSGGGGGQCATDSAELGAHGYEVQSQVTVDDKGGTWEPLFEVWRPLSTYTPL
jgi:hypothetical protein